MVDELSTIFFLLNLEKLEKPNHLTHDIIHENQVNLFGPLCII